MPQVAEVGSASNLKAAGTIFIGVVGAGVLGLPYAFAQAGLAVGIGFLTLVAALALYCMLLLAQCKRWGVLCKVTLTFIGLTWWHASSPGVVSIVSEPPDRLDRFALKVTVL